MVVFERLNMLCECKDLVVVGAGSHARVVIDTAELLNYNIIGIIDINYKGQDEEIIGYKVVGNFSELSHYNTKTTNVFIAIGDSGKRAYYFEKVRKMGFLVPNIIHPTSILSKHIKVGEGVFINAGTIINAKAEIGCNTIINTGVILDHEVYIGKHSHIAPGCKIAGRVKIGNYTFIGIGTAIIDKITIGNNVKVGAGSVVIRDVKSNSTMVGIPAREIK